MSRLAAPIAGLLLFLWPLENAAQSIETAAKYAFMMEQETGTVVLSKNAEEPMAPASMSKLMTIYMVFERLKDGRLSLDDTFPVSKKAWQMKGSRMFVEVGTEVRVEDLLRGIIVQSGNDACVVIAEGISGEEAVFADEMTETARTLGMQNSHFRNASGWPDPEHRVSAQDLAILAKALITEFPDLYKMFGEKSFTYNNIKQGNRNPLLYGNSGADGLKTGHTEESGYGLVASAQRDGKRFILVVNGLDSVQKRGQEASRLLSWGFREFERVHLFDAGEEVERAGVWLGENVTVPLTLQQPLSVVVHRKARNEMQLSVHFEEPIPAPIEQGASLATLRVQLPGAPMIERPLVAANGVAPLGTFGRVTALTGFLIWGP